MSAFFGQAGLVPSGDDLLTRQQAAELVGCKVELIESYIANSAIRLHPGDPSLLERSSVEEFRVWHDERMALFAWRAGQPNATHPPEPEGWLTAEEAGEQLGVTGTYASRLVRQGALLSRQGGRRRWIRQDSVDAYLEREQQWISAQTASELTGIGRATVYRAAWAGLIEQRPGASAKRSLSRESVFAWAKQRHKDEHERRRQREAKRERPEPEPSPEPSVEHEWVTTAVAAARLGVSESRVKMLARDEKMPATKKGGRWWFRTDHLELFVRARARSPRVQ